MPVPGGRWVLLLGFGLLLSACGLAARPAQEFLAVSDDYLQRLRWQDYNGVARHLVESEREAFLAQWSDQPDLRLTEAQLDSLEFRAEGREARTRVTLEYYRLPSTTIERLRLNQSWEYRGGDRTHPGQWLITTPFPPAP
jgi:hypothetical protein